MVLYYMSEANERKSESKMTFNRLILASEDADALAVLREQDAEHLAGSFVFSDEQVADLGSYMTAYVSCVSIIGIRMGDRFVDRVFEERAVAHKRLSDGSYWITDEELERVFC
jgi:hypothetical protein